MGSNYQRLLPRAGYCNGKTGVGVEDSIWKGYWQGKRDIGLRASIIDLSCVCDSHAKFAEIVCAN